MASFYTFGPSNIFCHDINKIRNNYITCIMYIIINNLEEVNLYQYDNNGVKK